MNEVLAFLLFGLVCGFLFGFVGVFQNAFCSYVFTFITDVMAVLLCTLAFFCLFVGYSNGYVRYYYLLLSLLGLIIYRAAASFLFSKAEKRITLLVRKLHIRIFSFKKVVKNACKSSAIYNIIKRNNKRSRGVDREGKSRKGGKQKNNN